MAPLPEHREILDYLPSGKAVCYDHQLRVCGICCVDYTFDEFDESDENSQGEYDSETFAYDSGDDDEDRVFVLWGSTARFSPHDDEQVVGPAARIAALIGGQAGGSARTATTTPSNPSFYFCGDCKLTWLVGAKGISSASNHPSHHTLHHEIAGTSRSLVVWTDGACLLNGQPNSRAGIGCYFGPGSSYNMSEEYLPVTGTLSSQKAELEAVARAIETVRSRVIPARRALCETAGGSPSTIRDTTHLRLIIATDSSYIVECMCEHYPKWTEDKATGELKNKGGSAIKNSAGFLKIMKEVEAASMVGLQVAWYHVRREENTHADRLSRKTIEISASKITAVSASAATSNSVAGSTLDKSYTYQSGYARLEVLE
jgi:ribonuclease HI